MFTSDHTFVSLHRGLVVAALAVAALLPAPLTYAASTSPGEELPAPSVPETPAPQESEKKNGPPCSPLRNVGIAESAEHYYGSCEAEQGIKAGSNSVNE
jgi:hypothetical protein